MREMKGSGLRWAGEIPVDWKITKGKYFMSVLERPVKDNDGVITCFRDGMVTLRSNRREDGFTIATVEAGYQGIEPGDLVVHGMDGFAGAIGISDARGKGTPALNVLDCTEHKEYMMYLLRAMAYSEVFMALSTGIRVRTCDTNWRKLRELNYLIPSLDEQRIISEYLDHKSAEIEALTADIQVQIDTLEQYKRSVITEVVTKGLNPNVEMRDSGIDFVGTIPAHWIMHPVYYYFGERKKKNIFGLENNLLSLSYGKIVRKDINTNDGLLPASFNTYNIIEAGDIVIRPTDLQNDKRSLRTGLAKERGIITSAYIALMPIMPVNTGYFHYLLHAFDVMKVFYNMGNGVRQGLNYSEFSRLMVMEPTRAEQDAIVSFLDAKCAEIDSIIADKKAQIETLGTYKKSLIFEYVTGKKEVPETVTVVSIDPHVLRLAMIADMPKRSKGEIADQKLLYLCDTYLGLGLSTQYYRWDYGPFDKQLYSYIDTLVSNGWYKVNIQNKAKVLVRAENHAEALEMYGNQLAQNKSDIEKLVQYFGEMRVSEIERFATLFAVWNDFIIDGIPAPSDYQIIDDVLTNWGPTKGRFSRDTWQNTLMKMKRDGIIPKGLGLHTLPKPEGGKSDA